MNAKNRPIDLFEFLDETHGQVQIQLGHLRVLVDKIGSEGLDVEARALARQVLAFFNHDARQHHLDEEKHVFPPLLASQNPELEAATRRLIQDHGWLEENWLYIEPSVAAACEGNQWFDPVELKHAVDVFEALYIDHLLLEESVAYPHARLSLQAYDQLGMGREMAQWRSAKTFPASG